VQLDALAPGMRALAEAFDHVVAGRPVDFTWRGALGGAKPQDRDKRVIIEVDPALDFSALEPGWKATAAIREAAREINAADTIDSPVTVRLTGPTPIADEEFGTVKEGAVLNHTLTILAVLLILWLALRSGRIILACFISLIVGLAITAALGLLMVGAFNLISIAFAVLFVGLGVDFGIQYSVRYRAERFETDDLRGALVKAAGSFGVPLTLAAASTAAGFMSFLPTAYKGVSELGQIAGVGMVVAFITSITLLPALLMVLNPPGEPEPLGYKALAPVDRFMERHRIPILVLTGIFSLGGLPLLYYLSFDFNPMHLRSPKVESVATYLELAKDPHTNFNSIEVLAPSLGRGTAIATKLAAVPQVSHVMTVKSFIPEQQEEKLALIKRAAGSMSRALNPPRIRPTPSDADKVTSLTNAAANLVKAGTEANGPGAEATKQLSDVLLRLAKVDEATRTKAEKALIVPLTIELDTLRNGLSAEVVTLENLPPEVKRDWVTADGRARISAAPKGDPNDNEVIREFARAVLAVEPSGTGAPVSILESGDAVVHAFLQAGAWALVSITIILWITLGRLSDVLLTLVPLILAGVVTLEICVLIGLKLNFANIIALPLLLGVGVAFKIYYIMAWRAGQTNLLQSSLTRAVFYSAMATATAFGSLWFSSHPGTSSMGKLMALSLVTTLAAAVLFQPVLMGPPREVNHEG
jgi:hopanoid biosynthesis associated RND transporter like protein HpnN